ncbi:MAG: hypothetical protein AUJ20_01615 [Comamonadaceae bacterium CG1_02_60_18]|nr:MAG: hypothetical protein AUJ20_01615 [Comamonadaceae bacterium CG1_02_60_18]PIQ51742.1 MAG: hypothetical protein COW02_13655 [Comamonadaceae bacterium CG12_big_fil_rev_8_21_14_0_65_59_15]
MIKSTKLPELDRSYFLDGIRGWASLMVLFSHLVVFFLANSIKEFQPWIFGIITDGNLVIFIFFVLSGFVLTLGYVQKGERQIIVALALRRYPRFAIPIICTCILVYLLAQNGLFFNHEAGLLTKNASAWRLGSGLVGSAWGQVLYCNIFHGASIGTSTLR